MERDKSTIWSVSGLVRGVREVLEGSFGEVQVEGEISNLRVQSSGHWYFTLKDSSAQIRAVMFRGDALRVSFRPKDGDQVLVEGELTVYEPRGDVQVRVRGIKRRGLGTLLEQFEALKRKLEAEGLFSAERKKSLPIFPRRVAVITSPTGAALQDFLRVIGRRCPRLRVVLCGVRVQGEGAAAEILGALRQVETLPGIDVVVLTRGGGSLEDLWCFNDESLVRGIAACKLPVISAVGHETDVTLADFAADLRAPTPSAAAEMLSRADAEWIRDLKRLVERMERGLETQVSWARERLVERFWPALGREARRAVEQREQQLDGLVDELARAGRWWLERRRAVLVRLADRLPRVGLVNRLEREMERLKSLEQSLELLSPRSTLARGYAWVWDEKNELVKQACDVRDGQRLWVEFLDGRVLVRSEKGAQGA